MKPALSSLFRHLLVTVAALSALIGTGHCEDLTTSDGKTYHSIKVSGETPENIKLIHDGGISLIAKKLLPAAFIEQHELTAPPQSSMATADDAAAQKDLANFRAASPVFTTKDGREFRAEDIMQVDPGGLKMKTSGGIVRVKFADLPMKVKTAFHFDALKAGEFEAGLETQRVANAATIKRMGNVASIADSFSFNARLELVQNIGRGWICRVEVLEMRDDLKEPAVVDTINRMMVFGLPLYASLNGEMQRSRAWSGKIFKVGNYAGRDATTGSETRMAAAHTDRATAIQWLAKNSNAATYTSDGVSDSDTEKVKGGTYTGTGFVISSTGHLATAAHVVEEASEITVRVNGATEKARVIAMDKPRDIAIIKVDRTNLKPLRLEASNRVKLGGELFCIGYPMVDRLGVNPKLTKGQLNAQTGLRDDPDTFQMSVQVQPGNSGGPVCNNLGEVVGVVSKTSSTLASASGGAGAVPQNVNFATKADALINLAKTVADLPLATGVGASDKSAEDKVMDSTFLITVVH